jgi:DNA-binding SARP family transcriptional activator
MEYFYDVRLNTFGKLEISVRDKAVEEKQWQKRKFKLIFIFLILSARKEVSKDKIIDLFFTDTPPESIDNLFHQAVSRIRNLVKIINPGLQAEKEKGKKGMKIDLIPPVVLYEEKLLKINPDSIVYIDCSEFENIYKAGGSIKDKESKSAELKKAISLYKGEFLEGNYERWIEELRTRYKTYFISLSEELIKLFFENQNYSETLNYSENLLKHDPLNLEAAEYILKAYEKMNKLSLARTKYEKLKRDYEKEYGENLPDSFNNKVRFAYK